MHESLLNPMPVSFHREFPRGLESDGIALIATITKQLYSLQDNSSFHDKPYIVCHLVFFLEPFHCQQLQVQVLQILGGFPHHVGVIGTIHGPFET